MRAELSVFSDNWQIALDGNATFGEIELDVENMLRFEEVSGMEVRVLPLREWSLPRYFRASMEVLRNGVPCGEVISVRARVPVQAFRILAECQKMKEGKVLSERQLRRLKERLFEQICESIRYEVCFALRQIGRMAAAVEYFWQSRTRTRPTVANDNLFTKAIAW